MDVQTLTAFFKWCTIINLAVFAFSAIMIMAVPDFIFWVHGHLFHVSREAFDAILYAYLGLYKIVILALNIAPYIALRIIGTR